MKRLNKILFILLLTACGSKEEAVAPAASAESASPTLSSALEINSSNYTAFTFSGACSGNSKVSINGALKNSIDCIASSWTLVRNMSWLPNGLYEIEFKQDTNTQKVSITKNTLDSDNSAYYQFNDELDIGKDTTTSHDAVSVVDVSLISDPQKASVAAFNGASSNIQISDGTFFNKEFEKKSWAIDFKPADVISEQILIDEGGSTNSFGVKIDSNKLEIAFRKDTTQEGLSFDLDTSDIWYKLIVIFNKGEVTAYLNNTKKTATLTYSVIPDHSGTGGLGKCFGNNSFGDPDGLFYNGSLENFQVFDYALNSAEQALIRNISPELSTALLEDIGLKSYYAFETVPAKDETGSFNAIASTDVSIGVDGTRGNIGEFTTTSHYQVNQGSFFHEEFQQKTTSLWFYANDFSTTQTLLDEGGSTNGVVIYLDNDYLIVSIRSGGQPTEEKLIYDIQGETSIWNHVAFSFENSKAKLFFNGEKVVERTTTFSSVAYHSDNGGIGSTIGSDSADGSSGQNFEGSIDEVRVFSRALSEEEISYLHSSSQL